MVLKIRVPESLQFSKASWEETFCLVDLVNFRYLHTIAIRSVNDLSNCKIGLIRYRYKEAIGVAASQDGGRDNRVCRVSSCS